MSFGHIVIRELAFKTLVLRALLIAYVLPFCSNVGAGLKAEEISLILELVEGIRKQIVM